MIAYVIAFLLTYYVFMDQLRPFKDAERAAGYITPINAFSIYSALIIISIIAFIYYFYIITIIDRIQTIRKGLNNSEPVLKALIIGSVIALIFQIYPFMLIGFFILSFLGILGFILVSCVYGYIGLYFGRRWPKLSWRWGIWLTLPWLLGIIFLSGRDQRGEALIWLGIFCLLSFINLFAACIGAFVGAAKFKKEVNNIKEG